MKRKLFWVLYYSISVLLVALAVILLPEFIVFNLYSLFPVGYMVLNVLFALIAASKLPNKIWNLRREQIRLFHGGRIYENPPLDRPYNRQYAITSAKIVLAFLPVWLWFVFFFKSKTKIASAMIFLMFALTNAIQVAVDAELKAKKERAEHEKELKEQISREQEGKWK